MIATILPSSTTFHAVDYNERKVSEGVAELLEIKGFDLIDQQYTPDELKQQLLNYAYQYNERIKKPQFHLAISCRGDEYTYEQLLDIAHQYLKEMGYGEDGQPILIYAHHDTDNHHIHIVTSRVAPDGHKIDDHHERVHSQEVINRIMNLAKSRQNPAKIETINFIHVYTSECSEAPLQPLQSSLHALRGSVVTVTRTMLRGLQATCNR